MEDLFLTKEYNDAGVYAVRLLWKGAWQTVLLDNYFPYYADIKVAGALVALSSAVAIPCKAPDIPPCVCRGQLSHTARTLLSCG